METKSSSAFSAGMTTYSLSLSNKVINVWWKRKSVASGNVIQEKASSLDKVSSHKFGGLGKVLSYFPGESLGVFLNMNRKKYVF